MQKHKELVKAYQELAPYYLHQDFIDHLLNSRIDVSEDKLKSIFNELWIFMEKNQANTNPYLEIWENEIQQDSL